MLEIRHNYGPKTLTPEVEALLDEQTTKAYSFLNPVQLLFKRYLLSTLKRLFPGSKDSTKTS